MFNILYSQEKMKRTRAKIILATVILINCIAGCSGGASSSEPISTTKPHLTSLPQLTPGGPAPAHWSPAWRITSKLKNPSFDLVAGVLILGSRTGIQSFDARSGELRWQTTERTHIRSYEVSSNVVLVVTEQGDWYGVEAATGKVLWRRKILGTLATDTPRASMTTETVPVLQAPATDGESEILGVDARSGKTRWRLTPQLLMGCTPDTTRLARGIGQNHQGAWVGGHYLAMPVKCNTKSYLLLFNMDTSKVVWRYAAPANDNVQSNNFPATYINGVAVDGTTSITDSQQVKIMTPTGGNIANVKYLSASNYSFLPPILTADNKAWVSYFVFGQNKVGQSVIDLTNGHTTHFDERSDLSGDSRALIAFDGARIYLSTTPGVFAVTDVQTSSTQEVTVSNTRVASPSWLAVAAGSLYVAGLSTGDRQTNSTTVTRLS
ncbi:PQQ-binding-like beta-propeller repeat protein [Actinomadura sp. LD22]|uniref:PQQ-binding-like beta-propeller repeat protein n=1 Tax=Actinomadura physcomitrii TaxID=2650748 RepID=A0A6I4MF28_9ACTN|nr:PQQ-binding-like beta-propeller repeat protein [Actinomadura physcomitrii]MWA00826.1 PQQ-binding-like beta-propeller repeat protein [Actinomadura physcomitrii]